MHAVTALSVLALAGSALAVPYGGGGRGGGGNHVVYTTEMYTVVVTQTGAPPKETYAANPRPHKPTKKPEPTVVYTTVAPPKPSDKPSEKPSEVPEPPKPTSTQEPEKPSSYAPEPEKPSSTSAYAPPPAEPTSGGGGGGSYMGTVNTWRSKLGLPDLEHDDKLESNAADTCTAGNGEMVHKLNPGTMGQVLAPGQCEDSAFEHVFVGGWLCEKPNMAGMDGVCGEQSKGWTYAGQTGHADILTNTGYSKIGCKCVKGIWGCDVA